MTILIMGPGGYKFGDNRRMGLPLEAPIVAVPIAMTLIVRPLWARPGGRTAAAHKRETSDMKFLNPETIAPPASHYSHGGGVPAAARRLIVAGQIGLEPDGRLAEGLEAQMERCWLNLFAVLEAAGMTKRDLVKYTVFVTRPDATARYRAMRDRLLEGHAPPATYLVVAGLASPELLVEIEGEAVAA